MSPIIKEVTQLYPVKVERVYTPKSIKEIQEIVQNEKRSISIWGGRYSMGGQTAIEWGVQIDMRQMNRILHIDTKKKQITVETWILWKNIQKEIDRYDLSIMTMQTYSNFTVWGSLAVNVHGRYIGYWPLILSVESFDIVLASGELVHASRKENSEIFYGAIGTYGSLGIIVTATLNLQDNRMLERVHQDMLTWEYKNWFKKNIRDNRKVIFHNADLYPPFFRELKATSWVVTDKNPTTRDRLIPEWLSYSLHKRVYHLMTFVRPCWLDIGKWMRQHVIDPLVYRKTEVHSRNYEASYDVAELEPVSRKEYSYVLQEYFCPVSEFETFVEKMREIFLRHNANIINVSVRHALSDDGSVLAWAQEEVFAFVVYYSQATDIASRREVAVWTRELIDAAISVGGRYYLPYQLHATHNQIKQAYRRWDEFVALKKKYDQTGKFSNKLLEKYYFGSEKQAILLDSRFVTVYDTEKWRDKFYIFLQNIFHIAPTHIFHSTIQDIVDKYKKDDRIYHSIQNATKKIKPFYGDLVYGIPALFKQKKEMQAQTLKLLEKTRTVHGSYLEIGGAGRYVKPITSRLDIEWEIYLISDEPVDYSPVRILERWQISQYNTKKLTYNITDLDDIPNESVGLITIFIGLHHAPLEKFDPFIQTLVLKMKKWWKLIVRDHNVEDPLMHNFVAIAHDIYNAGTGLSWEKNNEELRYFRSLKDWKLIFTKHGLEKVWDDLVQANDPTDNTLMRFDKK